MIRPLLLLLCPLVLIGTSCSPKLRTVNTNTTKEIDWQGHRGARGLLPENSIPAFLKALEYPAVRTLELDVVVTADDQVVVSHEPWMAALFCSHADGTPVAEEEEKELRILEMTLTEVQQFDTGQRGNTNFPEQVPMVTVKPSLVTVISAAEFKAKELKRPLPFYNIEIKSAPDWDSIYTPKPDRFAELVLATIYKTGIASRTTVQSFDIRSLEAVHQQAPNQTVAYLIANENTIEENLALLSFTPEIYSPYFELLDTAAVDTLHQLGIQAIPWTVNEVEDMHKLLEMGVDGIITDYPDRIPE